MTTLAQIDADLDEIRANVDHGEAQYNPWALSALRAAERLREFALTVEQTLAAAGLTNIERLGRIAVAHARLTQGRAEQ